MSPKEKILVRVRKLLEKAASTHSEEEAMIFNQKAEELLVKWKIEEIELEGVGTEEAKIITKDLGVFSKGKMSKAWGILAKITANHFGADVYMYEFIKPGTRTVRLMSIKIVGYESDIESTELLFQSLKQQAMHFLAEAKSEFDPYYLYLKKDQNTWDCSYVVGFASRVKERFQEMKKSHEQDIKHSTALVIQGREEKVKQEMSKLSFKKSRRMSGFSDARNAGRSAANKADVGGSRISATSQGRISA